MNNHTAYHFKSYEHSMAYVMRNKKGIELGTDLFFSFKSEGDAGNGYSTARYMHPAVAVCSTLKVSAPTLLRDLRKIRTYMFTERYRLEEEMKSLCKDMGEDRHCHTMYLRVVNLNPCRQIRAISYCDGVDKPEDISLTQRNTSLFVPEYFSDGVNACSVDSSWMRTVVLINPEARITTVHQHLNGIDSALKKGFGHIKDYDDVNCL